MEQLRVKTLNKGTKVNANVNVNIISKALLKQLFTVQDSQNHQKKTHNKLNRQDRLVLWGAGRSYGEKKGRYSMCREQMERELQR